MSLTTPELICKEAIADCLDRRRLALTETVRVATTLKESVLFQRACTMAIPMLYAHWEGYAKEVLQLYVEFLENSSIPQSEIDANLLAYAWSGTFRKLAANHAHERKLELIERFISSATEFLKFEKKEREIDTSSNLFFHVLENLAQLLCLSVDTMKEHERKLDALVNRRNNIAHGGREQTITEPDLEQYQTLVLELMSALEGVLVDAVDQKRYRRAV